MDSPILSIEQCRELDRRARDEFNIPTLILMENAGRGVADFIQSHFTNQAVVVFCGGGNNGGDGLVAARQLFQRGVLVWIVFCSETDDFQGDALLNYRIVNALRIPSMPLAEFDPGQISFQHSLVILDALLGTGFHGRLRTPLGAAVRIINELKRQYPDQVTVIAADIPSGLNGDEGFLGEDAVRADITLSLACLKKGLVLPGAKPFTGQINVLDIGIPKALLHS
jgi:NAD(P)H-hydrate epimerase